MTGPRIASSYLLFFLLLKAPSLFACEIPPALLTGRSLSETRRVLEGEIVFVADARLHDFEGRTTAVSGLVMANALQDAVGCVVIEARALDTGIGLRNRYMWEDYLEVAKFPEIRFVMTGLSGARHEVDTFRLTLEGELSLHGTTRNLRIPASLIFVDRGLEVQGQATLRMTEYAIARPALLFIKVKDEVEVRFRVLVGDAE